MIWWLLLCGWIVCGIFAYGLSKGLSRSILRSYPGLKRYDLVSEVFNLLNIPCGLIALLSWLPFRNSGICFIMPKELCERRLV